MRRWIIACLLCIVACHWSLANDSLRLAYDVDFMFNFDNRESNDPYDQSQTILGVRLSPAIGFRYTEPRGDEHQLMAGVSYIQPCGANWRDVKVFPTIYYRYQHAGFGLHFGFVPYRRMLQPLPSYLRSDSLQFAYPNIQGTLLQYSSDKGHVELLCDWRGMMSAQTREAFRIIAGGRYEYRWLYLGGWIHMNHLSESQTIRGVCDDLTLNPLVGIDFHKETPLDELYLDAGYLLSYQRDRRAEKEAFAHGFISNMGIRWRWIGLRNTLYAGQNQMMLYPEYRQLLNQGDPHYQASVYNRTDLYLCFVSRSFVQCYADWSFHVTGPSELAPSRLSHQQRIVCRFSLEELMRYLGKNSPQKK